MRQRTRQGPQGSPFCVLGTCLSHSITSVSLSVANRAVTSRKNEVSPHSDTRAGAVPCANSRSTPVKLWLLGTKTQLRQVVEVQELRASTSLIPRSSAPLSPSSSHPSAQTDTSTTCREGDRRRRLQIRVLPTRADSRLIGPRDHCRKLSSGSGRLRSRYVAAFCVYKAYLLIIISCVCT